MINIKRDSKSRPKVFESHALKAAVADMAEFYEKPAEVRSQQKYAKPFDKDIRNQFIEQLRVDFNNKCAYCESSLLVSSTNPEYDHFRPRHGARGFENEFSQDFYWWLTYEWLNIYLCCSRCNQIKSSWFPVTGDRAPLKAKYSDVIEFEVPLLIDPCHDDPEKHLSYNVEGEVIAKTLKGEKTIDIMQLNRSELVSARRLAGEKIAEEWTYILLKTDNNEDSEVLNKIFKKWLLVFDNKSPEQYLGYSRGIILDILKQSLTDDYLFNSPGFGFNKPDHFDANKVENLRTQLDNHRKDNSLNDQKDFNEDHSGKNEFKHLIIEKLVLSNFKCFSHLELVLKNNSVSNSPEEPLVLLLGENGVGKSSLLKALAIGLSGNEYIRSLNITGKDLLKKNSNTGFIRIYLSGAKVPIEVTFNEDSITSTVSQPIVNMIAYNSIRLFPDAGKLLSEQTFYYGAKAKSLFDYTLSMADAEKWLINLKKEKFDFAAIALKELMQLDMEDHIFTANDEVFIKYKNGDEAGISILSDGYKSLFYLAVDIMSTWENFNASFDLLEGIVMIDEIGSHLHPRWRMEVVGRLRKTFPKIHFILTTHEPLCLRGVKKDEAVVLLRDENNNIVLVNDLPDPAELRIDQILTSEFFGLRSTMDSSTELILQEYYSILAIPEEERNSTQKERLFFLKKEVPKIKHLGDTEREDIVYYVIDELLASKTREKNARITFDLKEEALQKVKELWIELDKDKL
jgi:uncharacterized protein (TIGR02646 family)